jgi:hypothetical protein
MANSIAELSKEVINFQYAVMFGVIGSVTFTFDKGPPAGVVFTAKEHWIEFAIFVVYFILDWWTANVRSFDEIRSLRGLFFRVFWIGFLGVTIIFLNSKGAPKYLLLFIYTFFTGVFDVITTIKEGSENEVLELLAAVPRLLVAFVLFIPAVAGLMGRSGVLDLWDVSLGALAGAYGFLKLARTELFKSSKTTS